MCLVNLLREGVLLGHLHILLIQLFLVYIYVSLYISYAHTHPYIDFPFSFICSIKNNNFKAFQLLLSFDNTRLLSLHKKGLLSMLILCACCCCHCQFPNSFFSTCLHHTIWSRTKWIFEHAKQWQTVQINSNGTSFILTYAWACQRRNKVQFICSVAAILIWKCDGWTDVYKYNRKKKCVFLSQKIVNSF